MCLSNIIKTVMWKVMWLGPVLEMMRNSDCNSEGCVITALNVLSLNMSKISIYLMQQTLQGDKWWWGQTFMVPTTVHCHLFLIRVTGGRSPAMRRRGAVLQSPVHLVFRSPFSRHVLVLKDLNVPLFDFIIPWIFSVITFDEPFVHQHNNNPNILSEGSD